MLNSFISCLYQQCGFLSGQKVLVALSGGADSMALVHLFKMNNVDICAAHCNFKLRSVESDDDELFVIREMQKLGVKLHLKSFSTKRYAKDNSISIEMAARDLRYNWFNEIIIADNIDWIATGHHKDDSIETFFLNLVRGTGIKGLVGIQPVSGSVIRPLLSYSRKQIENFCFENNIPYRTDSSNLESVYTRNKIRNEILPLFQGINPSFNQTMDGNMKRLNQVNQYLLDNISEIKDELIVEKDNKLLISLKHIAKFKNTELVLFEVLYPYGFNGAVVKEVVSCIEQGVSGKQFYSQSYRLIIDRFNMILLPREDSDNNDLFYIDITDIFIENPIRFDIKKNLDIEGYVIEKDAHVGQYDAELLQFPLTLRKWKQGDHFRPLGMNHFKKMSDFFIDQKFSLKDKEDVWLLLSGDDIIWVVGFRTDDRYKISAKTKKVTKITFIR